MAPGASTSSARVPRADGLVPFPRPPPGGAQVAYEQSDHRDEVELPDQRLEDRQRPTESARGREIAVPDGRLRHEAEVEIIGHRGVCLLREERIRLDRA